MMTDQIAGLLLLVVLAVLVGLAFKKFSASDLKDVLLGNSVIVVAAALFCLLLAVQLIKAQAWMPDLLKVVAGVVAGAIAAKSTVEQTAIGEQIQQAARDINNIKSDLNKIENSIVNQVQQSSQFLKTEIVAYDNTESFEINYRNNEDVVNEFKRIHQEHPDDLHYHPTRGEDARAWYDRQIAFFRRIPDAIKKLTSTVEEIHNAGWEIKKISFDFSNVNVVVLLSTEKRIRLSEQANEA